MNEDAEQVVAPLYRDAFKAVNADVPYITQRSFDLEKSADTAPWEPTEDIRAHVKNFDQITIKLITDETNLVDVIKILEKCRHVGLVLLGHTINRYEKPSLIVLATSHVYFAIVPNKDKNAMENYKGMALLRACLKNENLCLWTTNGVEEADCLYHQYDIKLYKSRAKCCTGLHVYLMKTLAGMTDSMLDLYPPRVRRQAKMPPRLDPYEVLASIWLNVDKHELMFGTNQLLHLTPPLNLTAENIIKKRCCLVTKLARSLEYYCWLELKIMNENVLTHLIGAPELVREEMLEKLNQGEEPLITQFVHLDGVTTRHKEAYML